MKPKIKSLIVGLALCASVISFPGCQSSPPVVAYKAEGVIITTVDTAMKAWKDYVKTSGKATQKQVDVVKAAYQKYYDAQQVAKVALTEYVAAQTDATRATWESAMAAATKAQGDIITLIQTLLN